MNEYRREMQMNDSEGELAVRIAREAVEADVLDGEPGKLDLPQRFTEKRGIFVTLSTFPHHELRGCIGYPEPVHSLGSALIKAAHGACHDPRFPPLSKDELDHIVVEVSILTPPEEIGSSSREIAESIRVGRDGLIIERGPFKGLLLPQVPVEWCWDAETFLCQTCLKAGLTPDQWLDSRTKVLRFQAEIFAEREPRGKVYRKKLV